MKKKPFIIIPAFNEENTIKNVVCSIQKYNKNIVVVDDASTDNTYSEANQSGVKVIRSPKNIGYDCALELGFSYAISRGATSLLSIDADGQHPIDLLPKIDKRLKGKIKGNKMFHRIFFFGNVFQITIQI